MLCKVNVDLTASLFCLNDCICVCFLLVCFHVSVVQEGKLLMSKVLFNCVAFVEKRFTTIDLMICFCFSPI